MSSLDPYPQIPPALLNSGDIEAYALHPEVEFIRPFDPKRLKTASYEIPCEGTIYAWESSGDSVATPKKVVVELTGSASFTLKPNSIVYLSPIAKFCLPKYLAVRFNLTITRVHQGLLLGTGPLVDPGFEGRLLIPLHNLTNQEVVIHADEMLIWVEVTKLSPEQSFLPNPAHEFRQREFPPGKKDRGADEYFRKAHPGKAILSSLQETLEQSKALNSALKSVLKKWSWGAAITTGIGGVALVASMLQVVLAANARVDAFGAESKELKLKLEEQSSELKVLREALDSLSAELASANAKRGTSKK